jgi:hypothetical protein
MTEEPIRTLDQSMLSAWQAELKATNNPKFKQPCLQPEPDLLPSFADRYEKLKALRRHMRRSLQRQWKRSLAGIALLTALGQAPALAATINVGGTCTLVRAIVAANNNTTASGNCRQGSGADTIVLPRGSTQRLTTVNNTVYGPTGLPVIRGDITIAGNNSTIRRAASAPDFHIFALTNPGDLTLRRTTVSGGRAPGENPGGGVYLHNGSVSLTNSTISGNSALNGGGVGNTIGNGGSLTLTNSTISDNTGSGIELYGTVSLTNSTVSNNTGNGVVSYVVTAIDSTISGNGGTGLISFGGGAGNSTFSVNRSTISGNEGSGVAVGYDSSATLTNSTISGNESTGVDCLGCFRASLTNTTVTGNGFGGVFVHFDGFVTLTRTMISGNTAPGGAEVFNDGGSITAVSFNLFGYRGLTNGQAFENFTPGPTDITATSNGNDPTALVNILNTNLANNGGPTRTHALVGGSPAIDTVTDGTCPPPIRDQRGVRRPQDGDNDGAAICDTGSFERR